MKTVYAITKEIRGPQGHGEPGQPYLCLVTDGEWFDLGEPLPMFKTKEDAESARKEFDEYNFYKVIPLNLV